MLEKPELSLNKPHKQKLDPSYDGPYIITKVWKDGVNYSLQDVMTGCTKGFERIPTNRMKLASNPVERTS
jgi:hypothetical protein